MKNKNGFTLIELLVVILIIGVLATISASQYRKIRIKSMMSAMLPYVKAAKNAQEEYHMNNGEYANDVTGLNVNLTCPKNWICTVNKNMVEVYPLSEYGQISIIARYNKGNAHQGLIYCWGSYSSGASSKIYRDICKSYGPLLNDKPSGNNPGIAYIIQ